jgi:hypothetical protein
MSAGRLDEARGNPHLRFAQEGAYCRAFVMGNLTENLAILANFQHHRLKG